MIVVDASALVPLLLDFEADAIRERLGGESAAVPHLIDLEVTQTLRRLERAGQVGGWRAATALRDLGALPMERYPHRPLLGRVWELRQRLTAYDAIYLALAESLECPLLTRDRGMAGVAAATVAVEVL